MIRYANALEGIEAEIGPNWLGRAQERTQLFEKIGRYAEERIDPQGVLTKLPQFWSEVKQIFIQRQHGKCIYCETMLEWGESSNIQWDVEHFRPKRNVRKWPVKPELKLKYSQVPLGDPAPGYHLLAYSHLNFAAACKKCNTICKGDYFPIASSRMAASSDPSAYGGEDAYLIYPLGAGDADPADFISFLGVEAQPKYSQSQNYAQWLRATIIIDFFDLNREWLQFRRAQLLLDTVWGQVRHADTGDADAIAYLRRVQSESAEYSNCASCFIALCENDRSSAEDQVKIFKQHLKLSS